MGVGEMAKFIGQEAFWEPMSGFRVPVKILDVRLAFGRIDYRVEPVGGSGAVWMSGVRVTIPAVAA